MFATEQYTYVDTHNPIRVSVRKHELTDRTPRTEDDFKHARNHTPRNTSTTHHTYYSSELDHFE